MNITIHLQWNRKTQMIGRAKFLRQRREFAQMIFELKRAGSAAVFCAVAASAFAQAPSDAQRAAIRSACRSDYIAHCSSVPPGGAESLQCLQKNMASLSAPCKSAVNAVQAPAAAPAKTEASAVAPTQ
jgi:hypothetical protein